MKGEQTAIDLRHVQRKPRAPCVCCQQTGPIVGRGLRGVCYKRERAAGTLARWPKIKRNARRLEPRQPLPAVPVSPTPKPGPAEPEALPETLTLTFDRGDRALWSMLRQEAERERRTPEQQILRLLETHLAEA